MNLIKRLYCRLFGHRWLQLYMTMHWFDGSYMERVREYCRRCQRWKPEE